jgi:hypothetical protein
MEDQKEVLLDKRGIELFLKRSSFNGLLLLYTVYSFYNSKKGFTFSIFQSKVPTLSADYCLGFFIATSSLGLLNYSRNDSEKIYSITGYDSTLASMIKEAVYSRAQKFPSWQESLTILEGL